MPTRCTGATSARTSDHGSRSNPTEDEAISLMSIAVDFGVTQVVDGNWGVHAIVRKDIFPD